jgi:hypothetical protein
MGKNNSWGEIKGEVSKFSNRGLRGLTRINFRRTLACMMPTGIDATFAIVKVLVTDFLANEKNARRFSINTEPLYFIWEHDLASESRVTHRIAKALDKALTRLQSPFR